MWGGYSGYTGKKLNEFIAQDILWHYSQEKEIKRLETEVKQENKEIADLKMETIKDMYV